MSTSDCLIVVSNRLPVTVRTTASDCSLEWSGGGLVSALTPVLRETGGCWVGWTGTDYHETVAESLDRWSSQQNYRLEPVFLTPAEKASYYEGFSNEIIWPLFHGLPSRCQFASTYWAGYRAVNAKFADGVERVAGNGDFIWVHDYHLMMLAENLRARGVIERLAYFHHIPFPAPDTFETLPWRSEVLRALMRFDSLGFQTLRDRRNFVESLHRCLPGIQVSGVGERLRVRFEDHWSNIGTYPISVDYSDLSAEASGPDVTTEAEKIRQGCSGTAINRGVLVLSEFAGAAAELRNGALLVNPHDTDKVAELVAGALRMTESEQRIRMELMRRQIESYDVFHWSESFNIESKPAPSLIQDLRATPAHMSH